MIISPNHNLRIFQHYLYTSFHTCRMTHLLRRLYIFCTSLTDISLHTLTKHCVRGEIHYEDTSEIVSGDVHGKKYVGDGAQVRMWGEKTCEEASQIFPAVWCPP